MQKKIDSEIPNGRCEYTPTKALETVVKSIRKLEIKQFESDKMLTPNRTNFNFEKASPFLVNINCRRPKHKRCESIESKTTDNKAKQTITVDKNIIVISDSDDDNDDEKEHEMLTNLFTLTQENLERHLSMTVKKNRKDSLIHLWRNKVNESRHRKTMIPIDEIEFKTFLSEHIEEIESSHNSIDTVIPTKPNSGRQESETEDSFITAAEEKEIINPKSGTIVQTQEFYEYFDAESNVVFYENRLLANPMTLTNKNDTNSENNAIVLNTSSESETCTDLNVPSDYDTDDLRKELKAFGDVPGPINTGTKRLYLKRLVRYKRHPQQCQKPDLKCSKFFSNIQTVHNLN